MKNINSAEQIRKEAIRRYLCGELPNLIYSSLKRSKKWFFKWLKRFRKGSSNWFSEGSTSGGKDRSKTPNKIANKVDKEIEDIVVSARKKLEGIKYAQIGANAMGD